MNSSGDSQPERSPSVSGWPEEEGSATPATIAELFEQAARDHSERIAVASVGERLTYRELDERSNRLARVLIDRGVSPDTTVALLLERTPELIVALVAIAKAGGAYVPLEAAYPTSRLDFMLSDAKPRVALTETSLADRLPAFSGSVIQLDRFDELARKSADAVRPESQLTPEHLAYILYTSGSTGKPKGVLVPQRAVERLVRNAPFASLGPETTILQAAPVAFDASTLEIWGALLNGGTVALYPEPVPTAAGLREAIRTFGVTTMWLTAALFNTVVDEDVTALGGLTELLIGGEALSVPHVRKALESLPHLRLINGYGPTETTTFATTHLIERPVGPDVSAIPIGQAIRHTRLYVLGPDQKPVPLGTEGELYIGGQGVARGYLERPELSAERFLPDPFAGAGLMYRTGDLVRMDEQRVVHFIGRADGQVKIRGFRIEVGEIEAALAKIPDLLRTVVTVRERQGEKRLVAYLVAQEGAARPSNTALRERLAHDLPDYMIPATFVWVDSIPMTNNGKVDYGTLPDPSLERPDLATEFVAPTTELEKQLAEHWSDIIGVSPLGALDNLFELGMSSLAAVRGAARLTERGIHLPVVQVFQHPTVRAQAAYLDGDRKNQRARKRSAGSAQGAIAIIGMSGRFPGAAGVKAFWKNLVDNLEGVSRFSPDELDPSLPASLVNDGSYVPARGVLEGVDEFDPGFFGIPPKEALLMDPQQRILFEVAWETLESAGYVPEKYDGTVGVFAGKYNNTYYLRRVLSRPDLISELGEFQVMLANEKDYVATHLAHRFGLTGPALSIHSACSTSLVAVARAVQSLRLGECDLALAGGASVTVPVKSGHLYQEGSMLSRDGSTRSFDASATGTVFSDGVGAVLLKRLDDAVADGDTIHAVIRGVAVNNDGGDKASFTAPSIEGQSQVILNALEDAGVSARDIEYVEAHGTATPVGDPIEVQALTDAYRVHTSDRRFCALGSVKSNVGHLVIAAGVTGLMKVSLALENELLPASLHFEKPNPKIDFESSPFVVVSENRPWPRSSKPRLSGVSAFGVGGTNAHVIVEEAPPASPTPAGETTEELLLLSARSEAALLESEHRLAEHLEANAPCLADVAWTLHVGRRDLPFRRGVSAKDVSGAARQLRAGGKRHRVPSKRQDLLFAFPGQGSQHPGMGEALYQRFPEFRAEVDALLSKLGPELAARLRELVFSKPTDPEAERELSQTAYSQPALFIVEYALARLWMSFGMKPKALVGHSVGEFVAAALSGVMRADDAVRLVADRGRLMQALAPGGMLSVRLPAAEVTPLLPDDLVLAVENSIALSVVAGPRDALARFHDELEARGVASKVLHTSHAFHSPMMDGAVGPFLERVRAVPLAEPRIPICSTVTGRYLAPSEATDPGYWARQLRDPVRFASAVQTVRADSAVTQNPLFLEVGPRKVLTTLIFQDPTARKQRLALASLTEDPTTAVASLHAAVADLYSRGFPPRAEGLHVSRHRIPLPTYPFERRRLWIEAVELGDSPSTATPTSVAQPSVGPTPVIQAPIAQPSGAPSPAPLPQAAPSPSPQKASPELPVMNAPAQSQVIETLCDLLEELSGIEATSDDSDVPFLELGLDSLFLTQFAIAVQKKFGTKMTIRDLQESYPTLGALAETLAPLAPAPQEAAAAVAAPPAPAVVAAPAPAHVPAALPATAVAAAPAPQAPWTASAPTGDAVRDLITAQLDIMHRQLALLSGGVQAPPSPVALPAAPATAAQAPSAPAPTFAAEPAPASAPAVSAVRPTAQTGQTQAAASDDDENVTTGVKYEVKKAHGAIARIHSTVEEITPKKRALIDAFIRRYCARTTRSKEFAQESRSYMADPRVVTGFRPLLKELVYPIVIDRSKGSHLWDLDGNEYVDALNGFGLSLFGWQPDFVTEAIRAQLDNGHEIGPQHPLTAETAQLICEFTGFDRAAFCNTGSEAVMGCTRIARTVTGRSKIVIFSGSYHGIFDEVIVRGTKKLRSIPAAPGIMASAHQNILVLEYGDPASLDVIREHADDIAAVIVEPVQSRRPDLRPREFVHALRRLTEEKDIVLVFDEVVCGFRVAPGGSQEYYGVKADLASYGKVIGGGLPVGVIAGKRRFMDALDGGHWQFGDDSAPTVGVTYFAGTFVRHPLAIASTNAVLKHLKNAGPSLQSDLNAKVEAFTERMNAFVREVEAPIEIKSFASLWRIAFSDKVNLTDLLFYMMRDRGVHIWDGFPCFFTTAHSDEDFALIESAFRDSVLELQEGEFLPGKKRPALKDVSLDTNAPPTPGARLGRDPSGNPAWFVPDPERPGQYLQLDEAGAMMRPAQAGTH